MEMRGTAIIGVAFGHGRADFGQLGLVAFDDSDDDFGPRPNVLHVEPEIRVEWAAHTGAALRRCCCTKIINSRFHDRNWALTCGGAKGTRTPGLLVANQTLFQLSYSPAWSRVLQTRGGQAQSRWTVAPWYWCPLLGSEEQARSRPGSDRGGHRREQVSGHHQACQPEDEHEHRDLGDRNDPREPA